MCCKNGLVVEVKLKEGTSMPVYQNDGDSGFDLIADEDCYLPPSRVALIPTNMSVAVPEGFELQVRSRSGLAAKKNLFVLNSPGTVDSSFRGVVGVILANFGKESVQINRGDRIAQGVICPVVHARLVQVDELPSTVRGESGFGSTGV